MEEIVKMYKIEYFHFIINKYFSPHLKMSSTSRNNIAIPITHRTSGLHRNMAQHDGENAREHFRRLREFHTVTQQAHRNHSLPEISKIPAHWTLRDYHISLMEPDDPRLARLGVKMSRV
jgi:hypothetical protein